MHILFLTVYFFIIGILIIYGLHRYALIYLYCRGLRENTCVKKEPFCLPRITVQLPVYNEPYVIERLVRSVCRIDYPKELLQIQVIDDSDDSTKALAERSVCEARREGFDIEHILRDNRDGFKAGALTEGLRKASGEFIAIFDADFIPHPQFLKEALPYFCRQDIGMVQTSWTFENRNSSLLTKIQAMFTESHITIEQTARFKSGRFFIFNGSSGIWRKKCIEESGGWDMDTLAEDLDLSYRAQLNGWKFVYLKKTLSTGELPFQMNAFKQQQKRWVQGTIQVAGKLMPHIIKSRYPLRVKIEAVLHLTNYLVYLFSLMASILMLPSMFLRFNAGWQKSIIVDSTLFLVLTFSVFFYHLSSILAMRNKNIARDIIYIPLLMAVSVGLSISNSVAILDAFMKRRSIFYRTPKYGSVAEGISTARTRRRLILKEAVPYLEVIFGVYFLYIFFYAFVNKLYQSLFFLTLFSIGFFYIGILSFFDYSESAPDPNAVLDK